MVQYSVMLKRHKGSSRPDVCIFRDEDRETAIREMQKYDRKYGFSIEDHDGRHSIADIVLVANEPIVGAPVLSVTPFCKMFDHLGNRIPGT